MKTGNAHRYQAQCSLAILSYYIHTVANVRFEVFTVVTMKNSVFWDVTPCGSCKNRRFEGP
jgi:hypothetical protein